MVILDADAWGPQRPIVGTPTRRPGSIRRTSSITTARSAESPTMVMEAAARDLRTTAAEARVVAEARFTATVASGTSELLELTTPIDEPRLQDLVGTSIGRGFRGEVDAALPELAGTRPPLYLLLDDLPGASLVSGYGLLRSGEIAPIEPDAFLGRADLCAGWAGDGVMMQAIRRTGRTPTPMGPPAGSLAREEDPLAWHELGDLGPGAMRRIRRIDVAPGGSTGTYDVDAMFRDSHRGEDGVETSLHEYAVAATVDAAGVVTAIEATAHVLPWTECPAAVGSAPRVVGHPVSELRRHVREAFTGVSTCTHLNDTLRSLADVDVLIADL